jgi:DNA modification methylase
VRNAKRRENTIVIIIGNFMIKNVQSAKSLKRCVKKMSYKESKGNLNKQFIIPPFSVLDSKLKYWKQGKEKWNKYNIKSELGRVTSGTNSFEDLIINPREAESNKIITRKGGKKSIFDPFLTEICYKWFCPKEGKILDPFAGGSVRGIVASALGYKYTGIELRREQVEANDRQVDLDKLKGELPWWIVGDAMNVNTLVQDDFDMIFTSPPYYDLEVYSNIKGELSAMESYEKFLENYELIISKCTDKLKDNRFAVFVVSDIRDKEGLYRNFVGDTKTIFIKAGMKLYNDIIFLTQLTSLPLRCGVPFAKNRKVGRAHQNVLVFYKGDVKEIRNNFSERI